MNEGCEKRNSAKRGRDQKYSRFYRQTAPFDDSSRLQSQLRRVGLANARNAMRGKERPISCGAGALTTQRRACRLCTAH